MKAEMLISPVKQAPHYLATHLGKKAKKGHSRTAVENQQNEKNAGKENSLKERKIVGGTTGSTTRKSCAFH